MRIPLRWLSAALVLPAALVVPAVANAATGFDASVPAGQLAFSSWGEYTANKVSLGTDYGDPANRSVIRVTGVAIPKGSTVSGATLSVNAVAPATDTASGTLNVKVAGVAADNPALPTTAAAVKALPYTTARTTAWTSTAAGWTQGAHPAPSVASLVQEVVNRTGWASGNALEFVVYDNGSTGNGYFPGYSASLHVDYTAPGGTVTPPAASPASVDDNGFAYTGSWTNDHPEHWTLTAGDSATTSFTVGTGGSTVSLQANKNSYNNIETVSIDGGAGTDVNINAAGTAYTSQTVWTSGTLAAGAHTLKVTVKTPNGSITGASVSNGTFSAPTGGGTGGSTGGGTGGSTGGTPTDPGMLSAANPTGRPFSATGPWNSALPASPVLTSNSAAQVSTISGNVAGEFYAYGDPVFAGTSSDPVASVTCTQPWGTCDPQASPIHIPTNAQPTAGSDGAMVVTDFVTNRSCDFWQVTKNSNTSYTASWATCDALSDDDAVGPSGGSTGGNINVLAGVVRTFEVSQVTAGQSSMIPHALSVATGNSCSAFQFPATKSDGGSGANCVKEGARLQLDPTINVDAIAGITPLEKAVAKSLQTYGAYNRDNCGSSLCVAFENPNGETDPYPAAGVPGDYWNMPHIPWSKLRVLSTWNGS